MRRALERIRAGGVVAVATESSFGLLADACAPSAIDALLAVKPRSSARGMPVLVPHRQAWLALVGEPPLVALALADAFWPGPLTLALRAGGAVDPRLHQDGTLALRVPGPSPAADLVRELGSPLTATSANPPGEPPALTRGEVERSLPGVLALGAGAPGGPPSTLVVAEPEGRWVVARVGAIPETAVRRVIEAAGGTLVRAGAP